MDYYIIFSLFLLAIVPSATYILVKLCHAQQVSLTFKHNTNMLHWAKARAKYVADNTIILP